MSSQQQKRLKNFWYIFVTVSRFVRCKSTSTHILSYDEAFSERQG